MTGHATSTGPAPGTRPVVLSLGSNLGDRLAYLQLGIDILAAGQGSEADPAGTAHQAPAAVAPAAWPLLPVSPVAVSSVYETAPVGGPEQADYLNAVLLATSALPARAILARCAAAEAAAGRVRTVRFGPRTLDADIIACGDEVSDDPELTLPHPRAASRAFVLAPWLELDPLAVLPGAGPVAALLAVVGTAGLRRCPELRLTLPAAAVRR